MRVGAVYTQTGVLAKGRAKGSAGEIEELVLAKGKAMGPAQRVKASVKGPA